MAATAKGKLQTRRIWISLFFLNAAVLVLGPVAVSEGPNTGRVTNTKKARNADWPRWRGPNADGVAEGGKLPVRWTTTENIRWSVKLPGWGTSSPVVYGNRVFVTSHQKEGKKTLLTHCIARETGKERWRHDFGFGVDQRTHEKSNLAVNTPSRHRGRRVRRLRQGGHARYSHDSKLLCEAVKKWECRSGFQPDSLGRVDIHRRNHNGINGLPSTCRASDFSPQVVCLKDVAR